MPKDTTFTVIDAVRSIRRMPDGSPISTPLKHSLLVLGTYWPQIHPSQERLARDLGVSRSTVNARFRVLEGAGLISRRKRYRATTAYGLSLTLIRECGCVTEGQNPVRLGRTPIPKKNKKAPSKEPFFDDDDYISDL